MRIATRLWLALLGAIVLVLGAGLPLRIAEEQRLLLDVTLRDRRFFAHALQAAILRDGGGEPLGEAQAMLDHEEVAASHIVARLVSPSGSRDLPLPGLAPREIAPLARGEVVVGMHDDEILTYVPIGRGEEVIAIELAEPRAVDALLARIGWWSLAGQTLSLAAIAALLSFALIRWFVGRPLDQLAALARSIAAGELTARAVLPPSGDEVGALAREMNTMAAELQETHRALDEANVERVGALEQLRHADRLRTVGQLASALAHELGTPLNVVSGYARWIEQEPGAPEETRRSANMILEETDRMTGIIRNMLDFTRRGGAQIDRHDLGELAEHAVSTLSPLARRHDVTVSIERAGSVPVRVDAQQISQVLTNLLVNALQATPAGRGVRLSADTIDAAPPVGVHAAAGRYARVGVVDEGEGFDPSDLPQLFEPFFTRKPAGQGTGLGLAVVEGIVREHGGWVTASREPGGGSRFEVFLPAAPSE